MEVLRAHLSFNNCNFKKFTANIAIFYREKKNLTMFDFADFFDLMDNGGFHQMIDLWIDY